MNHQSFGLSSATGTNVTGATGQRRAHFAVVYNPHTSTIFLVINDANSSPRTFPIGPSFSGTVPLGVDTQGQMTVAASSARDGTGAPGATTLEVHLAWT